MTTKKQAEYDAWANDYAYSVQGSYLIDGQEVTGEVTSLQSREDAKGKFVWGYATVRVSP